MKLITKAQEEKLLTNKTDKPVVKLFDAYGQAYWLLTEMDENGIAFGLCDLGLGFPELGYVDINELKEITAFKWARDVRVERDAYFTATKTLTEYLAEAKEGVRP